MMNERLACLGMRLEMRGLGEDQDLQRCIPVVDLDDILVAA